jgi:glycosyltransferase involved in cell wall biosynthesis
MNHHPVFSIITSTYNRKHTLKGVYEGLLRQTFTDFEWLIVDDGSNDGTSELVAEWKASFPIVYKYKENGGKPSAVNLGIACARGKYIIALDSDDVPVPEAIAVFVEEFKNTPDDVCAVGVLTMTMSGIIIGSELSRPIVEMTMLEAYSRHGITGDKWLAFKAEVAKKFLFPTYDSEKFAPEGLVFNRMSRYGYKTRFVNRPLLVHEYLPDGLTHNHLKLKVSNPIGFIAYHAENILEHETTVSPYYLKSAANIYATLLLCSKRPLITAMLMILALPIGLAKGLLDKIKSKRPLKGGQL